jgi:hypothetical protein
MTPDTAIETNRPGDKNMDEPKGNFSILIEETEGNKE